MTEAAEFTDDQATPGGERFLEHVNRGPESMRAGLVRLYRWASSLETAGVCELVSRVGSGETSLGLLVPGTRRRLVGLYVTPNVYYLKMETSVFDRLAPEDSLLVRRALDRDEALDTNSKQKQVGPETLEVLAHAYLRAAFGRDPARLLHAANELGVEVECGRPGEVAAGTSDAGTAEAAEGEITYRMQGFRQRNSALIRQKKEHALSVNGNLECEACGFDFSASYPGIGNDYIECHHSTPLSRSVNGRMTRLEDLALVCANCHRMLHRGEDVLSVEELRSIARGEPSPAHRSEVSRVS